MKAKDTPAGYLALTLHAHLPYVVHHGTWPHGLEWLLETAAETYLPLLRVLGNLERDGIPAHFNISLSPILIEQLAHPYFIAEFPKYLSRKVLAAREDEAYFIQSGDHHLAETARFWGRFFSETLDHFNALGGDIVGDFRHFNDAGHIEVLTSAATHSYLPLLGTDESLHAQIQLAVTTHTRHLGQSPRGIWVPECGYRPAGLWEYPVPLAGSAEPLPGFDRPGVEHAVAKAGLGYFFVDTHLVEQSHRHSSPYAARNSRTPREPNRKSGARTPQRSLYHPWYVNGLYDKHTDKHTAATVFARDPHTGLQVWSGDTGYPADANYLDFHKKRFPGGHRYWQVTGPGVDIGDKLVYWPRQAAERVREHAAHFVSLVESTLQASHRKSAPPVLCAPFDAELFGHWWFEGPLWLESVCRILHDHPGRIATTTCSQYLERYPRAGFIAMPEGSWGVEGNHQVWMNPDTSWTYTHIYAAELYTREVCTLGRWRASDLGRRIVQQLCRELLLLESSDWQFLITTGAARDYAETRFLTHNDQFLELKTIWESYARDGTLSDHLAARLAEIEQRDHIFPDLDPTLWAELPPVALSETAQSTPAAKPKRNPAAKPKPPASAASPRLLHIKSA